MKSCIVAIVLNEREDTKATYAKQLADRLQAAGCIPKRVQVSNQLVAEIRSINPTFVITDYLLGDYTTGLDLLAELYGTTQFIFLSDEPSPAVIREAFKKGSLDYIELGKQNAIDELLAIIIGHQTKITNHQRMRLTISSYPKPVQVKLRAAADKEKIIFVGPAGIGRSSAMHTLHPNTLEIDWAIYTQPLRYIIGQALQHKLPLLIEHIDVGPEELLSELQTYTKLPTIALGTRNTEDLKLFPDYTPIELPSLIHDPALISTYAESFFKEYLEDVRTKLKNPGDKFWKGLSGLLWPGEIRQLKSVIVSAIACHKADGENLSFEEILGYEKASWERLNKEEPPVAPSLLQIATAVNAANHNLRLASIKLGISPRQILTALEGHV